MDKKTIYVIGAVAVIIVTGVFVFGGNYFKPTAVQPSKYSPSAETQTNKPAATPTTQVPANLPTIVKAVMSRSIDAKGNATGVATSFNSKTDKVVYAVLTLKNVTKDTKLSYVRNLNGKYVDSKVALVSKAGVTTFYFAFEKGIGEYPKGTYALNLYVNGRRAQSLNYVFK